jgi:protein TonB
MADASLGPSNGATRARVGALAAAGGAPSPYDDPMSRVLGLDSQSSSAIAWLGYGLGAIALMLGLMVAVRIVSLVVAMTDYAPSSVTAPQEIDVEEAPPPPPPPAALPEPEAKPEPAPPPPRANPREAPPPPAAPAQAGKVLTAEPDPNEPVDLTGNTIVTGNAEAYAGGTTASNGTSTTAVRGLARPGGVAGGKGVTQAAPVAAGPDRARRASPVNHDWNAPFPPEADVAQIDEAFVTLEVDVRADGTPAAVRIVRDPGNGFGREARRYAMTQRFRTALDHDGNPIPSTATVPVHFSR